MAYKKSYETCTAQVMQTAMRNSGPHLLYVWVMELSRDVQKSKLTAEKTKPQKTVLYLMNNG